MGEIPKPTMNQLGRPPRSPESKILSLDKRNGQPARSGVESDPGPGDPAADHDDVDTLTRGQLRELTFAAPRVERAGVHGFSAASSTCVNSAIRSASVTSTVAGRSENANDWTTSSTARDCAATGARRIEPSW